MSLPEDQPAAKDGTRRDFACVRRSRERLSWHSARDYRFTPVLVLTALHIGVEEVQYSGTMPLR